MELIKLKSGTDIRGVAVKTENFDIELTDEAVASLAKAFALWLSQKQQKNVNEMKIAVGHDSRISAERIRSAVCSALVTLGVSVLDCGLASTPAMFMTTIDLDADGSIQITASHHPYERNGLKFFKKDAGIDGRELSEIIAIGQGEIATSDVPGSVSEIAYMPIYAARLRKMICDGLGKSESDNPLAGYHIVVDAGNGVGGFYATDVLKPLGADISGSRYLDPDGMFPNHIPNPENAAAMQSIQEAVLESKADLGIIFDTDVDRAGCVDKDGCEVNRNRLVALASLIALEGNEGGTIVTDSVTSDGLKEFIEQKLGGVHYRYRRGYRNVIDKSVELCKQGINSPLAIETSGHAAFRENYFLDDGAYLMTKIVILVASGLDIGQALADLKMPKEEYELRFAINCEDFRAYGESVLKALEEFVTNDPTLVLADDNREGIRASSNGTWFLLRLSVHDPIMPFNVESANIGGCDAMREKLRPFFAKFDLLNTEAL